VPEEESHRRETACDDDEVGFDEAREGHVSTCGDDDISDVEENLHPDTWHDDRPCLINGLKHGEEEGQAHRTCYTRPVSISACVSYQQNIVSLKYVTYSDPTPKIHISPAF
jgi:hypothetical protein